MEPFKAKIGISESRSYSGVKSLEKYGDNEYTIIQDDDVQTEVDGILMACTADEGSNFTATFECDVN